VKKNSFGLLELEMADLELFFEKSTLGPLGVNEGSQNGFLLIWATCFDCNKFMGYLRLCILIVAIQKVITHHFWIYGLRVMGF
jgi:hypothetical protein